MNYDRKLLVVTVLSQPQHTTEARATGYLSQSYDDLVTTRLLAQLLEYVQDWECADHPAMCISECIVEKHLVTQHPVLAAAE
jgi:hypothetical protein